MEVLICQSCGTVLRGKLKNCAGCGLIVSSHSPTTAPTLTNTNQALSVAVRPDPVILERVLVKRAAGLDVYSKSMSLGSAYGGSDSGLQNGNEGNGHDDLGTNSFDPAPALAAENSYGSNAYVQPASNGFSQEDSYEQTNLSTPATSPFDFAPATVRPSSYDQNSESYIEPQQPVIENTIAAPQSAFMSNQALDETPPGVPAVTPKPDFFSSAPATSQQQQMAPQSSVQKIQQNQSGSHNSVSMSRHQQSLSGAQPPPMSSGIAASVAHQSTMPPGSTPEPMIDAQAVSTLAVSTAKVEAPVTITAPSNKTITEDEAEDDDIFVETTKSASQLDFFASTKFPATAESETQVKSLRVKDDTSNFAEPDTRKFTRSKNKEKLDRLVEVSDENNSGTGQRKKRNSEETDFDFDEPQKIKKSVEAARSKSNGDDADAKKYLKKSSKTIVKSRPSDDEDDDEDDEDFSPPRRSFSGNAPTFKGRPAAKKGKAPLRGKSNSRDDDDDDDEDDEDDDFVGKSDRGKNKNSSRNSNNDDDDDDDDNDDHRSRAHDDEHIEEDEDENSSPFVRFLKTKVKVLGFTVPRHLQLVAIGIGLVLIPMLIGVTGAVLQTTTEMAKSFTPQEKLPLLTGDWHIEVNSSGKLYKSDMELRQEGDNIYAMGTDMGPYYIMGTITKPDHIQFGKMYRNADGSFAKPISYSGDFDLSQGRPYAKGFWRMEVREGTFYKAKTRVLSGQWQMKQTHVRSHVNVPLPAGSEQMTQPASSLNPNGTSKKPLWQSCFEVAGGLLVGSIFLVVFVWKAFGTNGLLSVKGKRQYIPSQYRGDHNKILAQLSKPLRPGSMPLGQRCEWKAFFPWEKKDLALPPEIRRKEPHMLLLGGGDKGKSRMIANLIAQDIEAGDRAVVLIDSDGTLVDLITRWISHHPKGRQFAKRVVVLDPTYKHGSLAYNPLEMPIDGDLQAAASSLVYGFKAIYTEGPGGQKEWNQQTANILRNAALLLIANGKTLTDLPTLLQDNDFRDILLENVERKKRDKTEYTTLLETWSQYKKLARTDQWITWTEPILNRVGPMLSDPRIRPILTQAEGQIKLTKVIQEKQILLVKIKKGHLDQNANLLGSLIVTGLKQAAMSMSGKSKQRPVALYLDAFDNFIEKETFESITSETDKFHIGLVGAIRTLQHLPEDFRNQLIINVATMACFALSKKDGDLLGPQMFRVDGRKIKHQTMSNFFNPVNTSPQFELISDEEKLNIDRVVGQDARHFYCYRVGSQAGVFHMKTHDFPDTPERDVNHKLIEKMHGVSRKAADNDD